MLKLRFFYFLVIINLSSFQIFCLSEHDPINAAGDGDASDILKHIIDNDSYEGENDQEPLQPQPRVSACTKISNFFSGLPLKIKNKLYSVLKKNNACTKATVALISTAPLASELAAGIFFAGQAFDSCKYSYGCQSDNISSVIYAYLVGQLLIRVAYDDIINWSKRKFKDRLFPFSAANLSSISHKFFAFLSGTSFLYLVETTATAAGRIENGKYIAMCTGLLNGLVFCVTCRLYKRGHSFKRFLKNYLTLPINAFIIAPYRVFKNDLEDKIKQFIAQQEATYYSEAKEKLPQILKKYLKTNQNGLVKIILDYANDIEGELIEHIKLNFEHNIVGHNPAHLLKLIANYAEEEQLSPRQQFEADFFQF